VSLDSLEHVTTVSSIVCNEVAQLFKKKKKNGDEFHNICLF
jgi:hypothetical protein